MICRAALLAAWVSQGGFLVAQLTTPDAQVEASVLKALADDPQLATQAITTRTSFGTVTLSGTVRDEAERTRAEQLAANAVGVGKVISELTLAASPSEPRSTRPAPIIRTDVPRNPDMAGPGLPGAMVLLSDGTYAPETPTVALQTDPARTSRTEPSPGEQQPSRNRASFAPPFTTQTSSPAGQAAGQRVRILSGATLRIRIDSPLSSDRSHVGDTFDATVLNDIPANGAIAVPRGATVHGKIVDSVSSGTLKGRGELSLQVTDVDLGGRRYPFVSDVWAHHGGDKTIETINKTAGFGALGAVVGAVAGGGVGAAIGGGVGAAAGLGSSAASGRGQVILPPEAILTLRLAQDAAVETVSQQEMQRLAYAVAPPNPRLLPPRRYRGPYGGPVYPVYYRRPFSPYALYRGYPSYAPYAAYRRYPPQVLYGAPPFQPAP